MNPASALTYQPRIFINLKNKEEYVFISEVLDCTNGNEDVVYVLYRKEGVAKLFIRRKEEFELKFIPK